MKKLGKFFGILILGYALGVVVSGLISETGFSDITALFTNTISLACLGVFALFAIMSLLSSDKSSSGPKSATQGKTAGGGKMDQYYDARWVTNQELLTEGKFMPTTYDQLPMVKKTGIVIRNLIDKNKYLINMYDPIHALIIGTTGSGKTQLVINPTIRILSRTAEKPCMVITDPKGELYNSHSIQLREAGYRIMVLDLRNPYASTRWNPLDNSYMMYHRARKIESEVKLHKGDKPSMFPKLKTIPGVVYNQEWYEFNGVAYPYREIMESDINAKKQELIDSAENELREVCSNVMPVGTGENSSWERGAQDFLYSIMLAMLEDSTNPELGMTRERFNFYNVTKIAFTRDSDANNQFGTLKKYFQGRDVLSKASGMASTVINNAESTARGYMGVLQGRLSTFQDAGVCYATSYNDMNFDDFTDVPTAFFIKVPDEKESRHCIATMCISQLYKKLIEIASRYPNLQLPRTTYFLLDEFANLPKIEKMDSIITVARSRKIFFELVVQSYSQLDDKYGKESANTIRGNCNIQIFIGTEDQHTKDDFSKMCGDVSMTLENESVNVNEKKPSEESKTKSKQTATRPLIYPYELGQLPKNTVVVKIFKQNPIKTLLTPFYMTPQFDRRIAGEEYHPSKPLDEARIFYNIKERNKKVIKTSSSPFGGFDF